MIFRHASALTAFLRNGRDRLWMSGAWARVGPAVVKAREKYGVPQLYENIEALAAQQR